MHTTSGQRAGSARQRERGDMHDSFGSRRSRRRKSPADSPAGDSAGENSLSGRFRRRNFALREIPREKFRSAGDSAGDFLPVSPIRRFCRRNFAPREIPQEIQSVEFGVCERFVTDPRHDSPWERDDNPERHLALCICPINAINDSRPSIESVSYCYLHRSLSFSLSLSLSLFLSLSLSLE